MSEKARLHQTRLLCMIENNNEQIPTVRLLLFTFYFSQSACHTIKRVPTCTSFHPGYERRTYTGI
jgi:hypothetical protein